MGLATTKIVLVVTSQLLLVGFVFQNTCKTIFESIIFVFVMHPFDVGDRCVIDGVQMIVEEMNILSTVFLRYDMEKIYYPNSVLLMKPISNFSRSPDMGDAIDFTIEVSTSVDDFNALKKAIKLFILLVESMSFEQIHREQAKALEPKAYIASEGDRGCEQDELTLCVQQTINHQNFGEKEHRRSELVFELKKIFENLGIRYHLLPQEIHLTQLNMTNLGSTVAL
ncbi:hypothetical protein GH714_021300 [Hevea brasiliensis]|uniref:Mechanosensitive ion channel MscS domain-containing protein n=1 Tax=Hevea brasiliensis TaxID=3981 RepID=A0A6A6M0G5_HEVBR|nr:hypothetical protein GH714_021300 [Hevea brasiliensis]